MMQFLVAFLSPVLLGYLAIRPMMPERSVVLRLSVGAVCGVGLLSLMFFVVRLVFGPSAVALWIAEVLLLAGAAWLSRYPGYATVPAMPLQFWGWMLAAAFAVVAAAQAISFLHVTEASPFGGWDAWAIWNLRAKFLAQPDATWRGAFSPGLMNLPGDFATHPDYPLLLSGFVARCWVLTGTVGDSGAPIAAGGLLWSATVGLLVSGLAVLRGPVMGFLGGLILLSNALFALNAPTQYADVPLGLFFLGALVLLCIGQERMTILAGFAAGCAAWTKDEGLVFAAALAFLLLILGPWKRFAWFLGGIAVPLAATLYFKLVLAPQAGSWSSLTLAKALEQAQDPTRYSQIAGAWWNIALGMGTPAVCIILLLALLGVSRQSLRSPGMIVALGTLVAMLGSYFAVYVVTPFDLSWHLGTSLGRVLTQVVPSITFVGVALCRTADGRKL